MDDLNQYIRPEAAIQEWVETGHVNTTLIIARLACVDPQRAKDLAVYCQLPDYYKLTYSAATPFVFFPLGKQEEGALISKILHGFHGGGPTEVARRQVYWRDKVRDLMATNAPSWKTGFAIHAFGDAYAHTYEEDGARHAFGYPMGHATFRGLCAHPDHISQHPQLYMDYCAGLYYALCGEEAAQSIEFAGFAAGFWAIINHETFGRVDVAAQEHIISDFIIRQSGDDTTHADFKAAMQALDFEEAIAFLRRVAGDFG